MKNKSVFLKLCSISESAPWVRGCMAEAKPALPARDFGGGREWSVEFWCRKRLMRANSLNIAKAQLALPVPDLGWGREWGVEFD